MQNERLYKGVDRLTLKKEKPKYTNAPKATEAQLSEALKVSGGNYQGAASVLARREKIRITRQAIAKRVQASEKLQEICTEAKETLLDLAENKLYELVLQGDKAAIFFYLKTQGKRRGWSERQEITGEDGASLTAPIITVNFTKHGEAASE